MTVPSKITTYAEEGIGKLISQYQDSPRLKALLETYLELIQNVENVYFEIIDAWDIDTATGDLLLKFASWVGLDNLTGTDEEIRARVKAQIKVITSNGAADDFIEIVQIIFPGSTPSIADSYPAQIILDIGDIALGTNVSAETLFEILDNVPGAGIRFFLIYNPVDEDGIFAFAPADTLVSGDDDKGFADTGQTTGGQLAGVFWT